MADTFLWAKGGMFPSHEHDDGWVRYSEHARLQEQLEAVTRERDEAKHLGHESFKLAIAHQDRAEAAEARAARLEAALQRARPYVDCAVHDDGGIDHCDIAYRFDLEAIDEALDVKGAG